MKSLFALFLVSVAFNALPVFADETLPEIAPVEEPTIPSLDAPAVE